MRIRPASSSSYPLRRGNFVRPLIDGIPAFRTILSAVESARHSVWITVAFLDHDLVFPDAHGSFFDVIERAAARGVDVRVLFWSEPEIEELLTGSSHFPAGRPSFELLERLAPHVVARWDRLRGYCHHQKSWLVDAGTDHEVAFVGGINLDRDSIVSPGHPPTIRDGQEQGAGSIHDVYVELRGPSATDVHHNFVQRWNEASERADEFGAFPSASRADALAFPATVSPQAGSSSVQVARTIRAGAYRCETASPGASAFAIAGGESSIAEQYLVAIDAAERTIYIENQIVLCPYLFSALDQALARGVEVIAVVPATAMPEIARVRRHPKVAPVFAMLDGLARYDNFLMAALAANRTGGVHADVYVHSKVAVIDDEWATIGSANAMFRSFYDDTEMNVTVWDRAVATDLRADLFAEHLGLLDAGGNERVTATSRGYRPPELGDDRRAFAMMRECALANRERRRDGVAMKGQVFAIDPWGWAVAE
ncbi:MAG TPA: phosphatidylserine/phosphatidylglycerophosphate/cardiolipin synthase family protein [Candidatus Limnocylindrales bacterium]|nr:phosphatidylserine/phosphatidylglycerophosphate/cardiolipin synthase family protein [Candidatus Limnocylindrales bacterium]